MDWHLSVNAPPNKEPPQGDFLPAPSEKNSPPDLGPCLYLGSAGQRCTARSLTNGFCSRHQPDEAGSGERADGPAVSPRRVGAILTILALLWPLLADIVRALIRYFR
jgi:hypothetical protein